MTERSFRLVIGVWLVLALWSSWQPAIYVLLVVLCLEGLTNRRVPALLSRLRGMQSAEVCTAGDCAVRFEAERALRLLIATLLGISLFVLPAPLWWLPWFIGFALVGAGLSGICPMVQALRWVGLR